MDLTEINRQLHENYILKLNKHLPAQIEELKKLRVKYDELK